MGFLPLYTARVICGLADCARDRVTVYSLLSGCDMMPLHESERAPHGGDGVDRKGVCLDPFRGMR
jgi:hypothetical protein